MDFKRILIIALLFCFFIIQCSEDNPVSVYNPVLPRTLSKSELELIVSSNKFGFNLFKKILENDKEANIFISPLSDSMALGMVYNGARGTTQEAMQKTLELEGMDLQEVNEAYKNLINLLINLDSQVVLQLANSIWYRHDLYVESEFINLNRDYFNAEVTALDFSSPDAVDIINGWVNTHTNGKIKKIVKPIDLQIGLMFLINAIYFKGNWTYKFDSENIVDGIFYLQDGTQKTVKMMNQEREFSYFSHNEFQAIDLPYHTGNFSMTVILPKRDYTIDEIIAGINNETWNTWMNNFSSTEMSFSMPKFKYEYEINLNEILKTLGMDIAFSGEADFTGMSPGLFIGKVLHKSFIEVNEEGTEAAAATVVRMDRAMGESMIVNRPFLFVVRESISGTILFMGKITEPIL